MKNILLISPHFPPSNLAAIHRSRLFAQHLPEFGWKPVILTVDEKYYEEKPDWNLIKLLPEGLHIEKVKAMKVTKPRMVGDIGIRAFFQLYKRAKQLIKNEKIDFLFIPIPSFYVALLGRWLHYSTGIRYGIDYIDPWVHEFAGSEKKFSRHWWSTRLSGILEPIAVKRASLITGVAEKYFEGVLERNPALREKCITGAMPYGGEVSDHLKVRELGIQPYLFRREPGKIKLVYAGAMLPKAYEPLKRICEAIKYNEILFEKIEFHFIGTGKTPNDPTGYNIRAIAESFGLWETRIFEYPRRIPYLDVLSHLEAADGIFILGSTEAHYTPSKVYQGILSGKPILAVLHFQSTASHVIQETKSGICCEMDPSDMGRLKDDFLKSISCYKDFLGQFNPGNVDLKAFDQYSAKAITAVLARLLDKAVLH